MQYRTEEKPTYVRLRRERRSKAQLNKFPLEDLTGEIVTEERRANPDCRTEGISVSETKISQKEFQEYFAKRSKHEQG